MYTSTTRSWDRAPRPIVQARYPAPRSLDRHRSTPEALKVVTSFPDNDRRHRIGSVTSIGFGMSRASELYRMRTMPHLYDERDVESALDLERDIVRRSGHLLADCHRCRATLHVTDDTDACPTCGTEL
jgi:hypothetical protein